MSWVLSLARSGGTAGSQDGHETRRHRIRGPFPMGACLLLAGTLAGCGSSSNSTLTFTQQQQQPPEPELEQEPQTGGGSGEGEGDGSGGSGSGDQGAGGQDAGGGTGLPPTDTLTGDGDGDTDSGDTTTTDDGGQTSTQQQQQPPEQELEPEPEPQTGGGTGGGGGGTGGGGGGGQGGGGQGGGGNPPVNPPPNNPVVSRSVTPSRSTEFTGFPTVGGSSTLVLDSVTATYTRQYGFQGEYVYKGASGKFSSDVSLIFTLDETSARIKGYLGDDIVMNFREGYSNKSHTWYGLLVDATVDTETGSFTVTDPDFGFYLGDNLDSRPSRVNRTDSGTGTIKATFSNGGSNDDLPSIIKGEVEVTGFRRKAANSVNYESGDGNRLTGTFTSDFVSDIKVRKLDGNIDLKTLISAYTPNIELSLPTGFTIESNPSSESSILEAENKRRGNNGRGPLPESYNRLTHILKSGDILPYETPKALPAWLGTTLHNKDWSGRLYKDGKSLGVIYSNLPKKYPLNTWAIFFSPGGVGQHENLVLDSASGKLSWKTGLASTSPLSALNIPGFTPDQYGSISVSQGNHPGTFYSVPGTFSCASECILSLDSLGGEEFFFAGGGAFSFTPNDSATATIPAQHIETKIPPHVHFGYWLTAPENDGESWSIEPFSLANFYGEPEDYIPNLNNLQGSASYSGPATGIYTIPDHPMGGSTGQFRARVTLRANWGQPAGNPFTLEDSWTITGSVDGFDSLTSPQHSGFMRDWSLDLGKASMATQRDGDGGASTNNIRLNQGFRDGATTGSGPDSQTGSWTGRFWGKDSTAPGNRKNEPMAVTGEFTGHFGDKLRVEGKPHALGSVVGSFVAGKE